MKRCFSVVIKSNDVYEQGEKTISRICFSGSRIQPTFFALFVFLRILSARELKVRFKASFYRGISSIFIVFITPLSNCDNYPDLRIVFLLNSEV